MQLYCSAFLFKDGVEAPWQKCHCMCVLIFSRFIKYMRNKEMEKSYDKMHMMHLVLPRRDSYCLLSTVLVWPLGEICQLSLAVVD